MITYNRDGSGVVTVDGNTAISKSFAAGISPADILAIQVALNAANAPPSAPVAITLTRAQIASIYAGAVKMTDVRQFGSDYLAGMKALINAIEAMRVMRERTVSDTGLFAAYLASPGARTDLQLIDLQNADAALVQLLFTFDSGAPTNKSELFKLL